MLTSDAVNYFGSQAAVAQELGITPGAVTNWRGVVPPLRAYQLQELTGGAIVDSSKRG